MNYAGVDQRCCHCHRRGVWVVAGKTNISLRWKIFTPRVVVTSISVDLTFAAYLALYFVASNTLATAMDISLAWQFAILIIAAGRPSSIVRVASMSIGQSDSRK